MCLVFSSFGLVKRLSELYYKRHKHGPEASFPSSGKLKEVSSIKNYIQNKESRD